jgi:hypothetical protein
MRRLLSSTWQALKSLASLAVALLILFEEWGWVPLTRLMDRLARLRVIGWLEDRVRRLRPRWALVVFLVPVLLLLPVKVAAWWLMARGRAALGLTVFVLAKVLGTAIVARLFLLTRPQLLTLPWFARAYGRWLGWKTALVARVRASPPWRAARALLRRWRRWRRTHVAWRTR